MSTRGFSVPKTSISPILPLESGQAVPKTAGTAALAVLTDAGTADLHFVADDYVSGNWTSRVGGYTATLVGTEPTITPASASTLPGRAQLTGFATNKCFSLAAAAAHTVDGTTILTYEFIVKTPTSGGSNAIFGFIGAGTPNNQGHFVTYGVTNNAANSRVFGSSTGQTFLGNNSITQGFAGGTAKYHMITVVIDVAAPRMEFYCNGTSIDTDTTTTGSLFTTIHGLGIGTYLDSTGAYGSPWTNSGAIVEIMRHRQAFDDATVAARCAAFNLVKGY